jgi:lipoprotein-releasing system ATP-binding protein
MASARATTSAAPTRPRCCTACRASWPGEFAALIGPSGSGKSTLLNIIGLLEPHDHGQLPHPGRAEWPGLDDAGLTLRRRAALGFVFQFHHLLPAFTALENVTLPALMRDGRVSAAQREHARAVLAAWGWPRRWPSARASSPAACSSAWRSRARWCMQPPLVLADEPTGNLDTRCSRSSRRGVRAWPMRRMHAELARQADPFLVVTHDPRLAARCDRQPERPALSVELVDGRIAGQQRRPPGPGRPGGDRAAAAAPSGGRCPAGTAVRRSGRARVRRARASRGRWRRRRQGAWSWSEA